MDILQFIMDGEIPPKSKREQKYLDYYYSSLHVTHLKKKRYKMLKTTNRSQKSEKRYRSLGSSGKERYRNYLKTEHWKSRRLLALQYFDNKCFNCGQRATQVHHKNYSRLFKERDTDLLAICGNCHKGIHKLIDEGVATLKNAHNYLGN